MFVGVFLCVVVVAPMIVAIIAAMVMAAAGNVSVSITGAVDMVMVVAVQRQSTLGASAEQRAVFGRIAHHIRRAFAADVAVQANHPV